MVAEGVAVVTATVATGGAALEIWGGVSTVAGVEIGAATLFGGGAVPAEVAIGLNVARTIVTNEVIAEAGIATQQLVLSLRTTSPPVVD